MQMPMLLKRRKQPDASTGRQSHHVATEHMQAGFIVSAKVSEGMLLILRKLVQLYIFV
jgi:hypothetical protein